MNLPVLVPAEAPPPPPTADWTQAVWRAFAAAGNAVVQGISFVDADLRRELVSLPLMAATAVGRRRIPVRALPDDGLRPVVFVHGLAGHPGNFRPLATYLRRQGHRRLYGIGLDYGVGARAQAAALSEFIDDVLHVNGLDDGQVDIVAHSRGGIVARLALDDAATALRVATLVTVGTPHRGTVAARYGRGVELDELRPESDVVARLSEQLPWTGPRLICLWSASDPLVVPPLHAQVPGATNIELDGLTHCQLLLWPAGWRATWQALSENRPMNDEAPATDPAAIDPAVAAAAGAARERAEARRADDARKAEEKAATAARKAEEKAAAAARKAEERAAAAARKAEEKAAAAARRAEARARKAEPREAEADAEPDATTAAPSDDTPDPKWRRRKDARPEELITAALQLFAEQGYARANLRDVGKRAGVSKATVYLYFKNKEDLLLAAVQKSVVPILDFADEYEIDSDAPAAEMIRTLLHRWVDEFEARSASGLPKLVAAEAAQFPELAQLYVDAVLQRARRLFQRILKRGVRSGEFREVDVREVVHVLLAPLLQAQVHAASLGPHDPAFPDMHTFLDLHVDLFLAALRP